MLLWISQHRNAHSMAEISISEFHTEADIRASLRAACAASFA